MIASVLGELLQQTLLGLTALGTGLAWFLAYMNVRDALALRDPSRLAMAMFLVGTTGMWLLIAEAIFRAPEVPPSARAWSYAVFLTLALAGLIGLVIHRRRFGREVGR